MSTEFTIPAWNGFRAKAHAIRRIMLGMTVVWNAGYRDPDAYLHCMRRANGGPRKPSTGPRLEPAPSPPEWFLNSLGLTSFKPLEDAESE